MGTIDRLRSTLIETRGTLKILPNLPWVLPQTKWNGGRILADNAKKYGSRPALAYLEERYTWKQYNDKANQYADFLRKQGIGKGDVVALVMDNRPDFLFAFMGINKLRAVSAMINTNLTGKALTHAINIGGPKAVLVGNEHTEAVKAIEGDLENIDLKKDMWVQLENGQGDSAGYRVINDEVAASATREHSTKDNMPSTAERMCFIYTSGTTGLPKAAVITNQRWLMAGLAFGKTLHDAKASDTIYVALPLYHSSAQFGGVGATLATGASLALRRKFSASNFWSDVRSFGATRFMYIGELCRYLLNHPVQPGERDHKLKIGVGNGLRPDIWETFQDRFGVPTMREFYGATEGNAPLFNIEGRPGKVGRLRPGQVIVNCDPATGDIIRNSQG
ncbi:MAG: AMP-binding protein, partial [Chrysiogenetes bacterium]|nr:AMP-binding protein [Chrysiogenetes bacterium]